ncbi:hypothetical protein VTN77DRAFT_241 [Rasamsonia byssochlamydoides]|uniref:uncharacterized protein n=1 Tax=Rasamsonia byssochlamydoides TaxID=89139 RepID=UPI003742F999
MASPHLNPPLQDSTPSVSSDAGETPSTSSSEPSNPQCTPESSGSDRGSPSSPPARLHRLRTDFDKEEVDVEAEDETQGFISRRHQKTSDEYDEGYDSEGDFKNIPRHKAPIAGADYTPEEEQQVVKRFDKRLVLLLALLYLLSFLDRSNIGNAKIAGLADDLRLSSSQYEWLLTAFYITYIIFEWMTLMYRLVPPHIYISLCVFSWGLIASFQSLVTSFWALVVLRAFLGVAEAAFGPGVPFYLSLFYKREELAFRTGLFISAAPLATSFASSLAWLIVKLSSNGPIAPWRTLFLVEGFPSVVVAVFVWILIPDSPGKARFLTSRQRKVAKLRLEGSKIERHESSNEKFNWRAVGETLKDPKSYIMALMFFSCNVAFSSMPVFLPTIIKDMGYSSLASQALSAPPFLLSFVVVLVTASLSDRHRTRSPYLIAHALLSAFAYLAIGLTGYFHSHMSTTIHTAIRYLCIYPATCGFFSAVTIIITWSMDNRVAHEGKGTGVALLNIIGQFGPLVGTRLYPASDGPWYVNGMAACSFFMILVAILAFTLRMLLQRANRRAAQRENRMGIELETGAGEGEGLMGYTSGTQEHYAKPSRFMYII